MSFMSFSIAETHPPKAMRHIQGDAQMQVRLLQNALQQGRLLRQLIVSTSTGREVS